MLEKKTIEVAEPAGKMNANEQRRWDCFIIFIGMISKQNKTKQKKGENN